MINDTLNRTRNPKLLSTTTIFYLKVKFYLIYNRNKNNWVRSDRDGFKNLGM